MVPQILGYRSVYAGKCQQSTVMLNMLVVATDIYIYGLQPLSESDKVNRQQSSREISKNEYSLDLTIADSSFHNMVFICSAK